MNLSQVFVAGSPMEVIHILGYQILQYPQLLKLSQGVMARVWLGSLKGFIDTFEITLPLNHLFPLPLRVSEESLIAIHRGLAIFCPYPPGSPERSNTTLHRHTGTS